MSGFPYDRSAVLTLENPAVVADMERFVIGAYESDVSTGDPATELLRLHLENVRAVVSAKEDGVFCGPPLIEWFISKISPAVQVEFHQSDKDLFRKGDSLISLQGSSGKLLKLERTLLNFLQRMISVATKTASYVERARPIPVAATRKTLYGLLDKYAVAVGGGMTHRLSLGDAPMFKDNHFHLLDGNFDAIIDGILGLDAERYPFATIEMKEVHYISDGLQALPTDLPCPIVFLLDNFDPEALRHALNKLPRPKNVYFEASGGITLDNIQDYSKTGVDVISVGALTHSVEAVDITMNLEKI